MNAPVAAPALYRTHGGIGSSPNQCIEDGATIPKNACTIAVVLAVLTPLGATAASGDLGDHIAREGTAKGVAPCMICHGADGGGMAATGYPRSRGWMPTMAKQIEDFRADKRKNPVMLPMAMNLTEEEIAAVSAYYGDADSRSRSAVAGRCGRKGGSGSRALGRLDQAWPTGLRSVPRPGRQRDRVPLSRDREPACQLYQGPVARMEDRGQDQ
ncbi:cytochrome c [Thiocapsa sp.]|uniref:c-type cytochrome n=1 Tax=Thiocapsa sp. TaxID=2024551 RepID=UPI0035944E79